jgi:hypothetical protein
VKLLTDLPFLKIADTQILKQLQEDMEKNFEVYDANCHNHKMVLFVLAAAKARDYKLSEDDVHRLSTTLGNSARHKRRSTDYKVREYFLCKWALTQFFD